MADFDALPFPIGSTAGGTANSSQFLEGNEYRIPDLDYSQSNAPPRLGNGPDVRIVKVLRNNSGVNLLPGMAVQYSELNGRQVSGFTNVLGQRPAAIVDEFLPSTGVASGDLFYGVVGGLVSIAVSMTPAEANVTAGDYLTSVTAAGSTSSSTSGRVLSIVTSGATTPLATQILGAFAKALSNSTTTQAGQKILCRILNRL